MATITRSKTESSAGEDRAHDTPLNQGYTRTNIVVDAELLEEARVLSGLRTTREIIEAALRKLIRRQYQRQLLKLQGIGWEGDLQSLRRGRDFVIND